VNNFESLCVNGDNYVVVVFKFRLPVFSVLKQVHHSAKCVLVSENVFRVLKKRVNEICKQCFNHLNLFNVLQKE